MLMPCAAAGVSIDGAISADVETAAAARAVKRVRFSMTCLLVGRGLWMATSVPTITLRPACTCPAQKGYLGRPTATLSPRSQRAAARAGQTGLGPDPKQNRPSRPVPGGLPGPWESAMPAGFRDRGRNGHAHLLERHVARGQSRHPGAARSRL